MSTPHRPADHLLRTTLAANAEISAAWGLIALVGGPALAGPLGIPAAASMAVGAVSLVAAGLFWRFRSRSTLRPAEGWVAAVGDLLFGAGLVIAAVAVPEMTTLGRWLVAISGVAVVDLGVLEVMGTRRLATPAAGTTGSAARSSAATS